MVQKRDSKKQSTRGIMIKRVCDQVSFSLFPPPSLLSLFFLLCMFVSLSVCLSICHSVRVRSVPVFHSAVNCISARDLHQSAYRLASSSHVATRNSHFLLLFFFFFHCTGVISVNLWGLAFFPIHFPPLLSH